MAKTSYSETLLHATDADFRAWVTNLDAALVAVGLVQTADTGQANLATMTRPGVGVWTNYRIYRYSDALQATAPVFLRVEYGTSALATSPGFRMGLGRATDGAGNLTGGTVLSSVLLSSSQSAPVAGNTSRTWVGWKDGALSIAWACDSTGIGTSFRGFITLDRSRDGAGVAVDECLYYTCQNSPGNPIYTHGWLATKTGMASFGPTSNVSCWVPGNAGASIFGTKIQAFKHYTLPQQMRTHLNPLTGMAGEISNLAVVDIELFGTTHSYLFLGTYIPGSFGTGYSTVSTGTNINANGNQRPFMLWED